MVTSVKKYARPISARGLLAVARKLAISEALKLESRLVTVDHVFKRLIELKYRPEQLGNLAGSIFKCHDFEFLTQTNSKRPTNNGRTVGVWHYIGKRRPL